MFQTVQECRSDWAGGLCESCSCAGHSEEGQGGFGVPAERSLHQPGTGTLSHSLAPDFVLSHSGCRDVEAEGCCKTNLNVHLMIERSQDTSQLASYEAVVLSTAQNVHNDLCLLWKSLSYLNQTIEVGRRWADTRSGLMNHFLLLVASCAYGHHLAKEAIGPDWRSGGGNVRLNAIFSWRIGSCCSCDITLTHTSYHSIVGDQTHALSDRYDIIHERFEDRSSQVWQLSLFCCQQCFGGKSKTYTGAYNMVDLHIS